MVVVVVHRVERGDAVDDGVEHATRLGAGVVLLRHALQQGHQHLPLLPSNPVSHDELVLRPEGVVHVKPEQLVVQAHERRHDLADRHVLGHGRGRRWSLRRRHELGGRGRGGAKAPPVTAGCKTHVPFQLHFLHRATTTREG